MSRHKFLPDQEGHFIFSTPKKQNGEMRPEDVGVAFGIVIRKEKFMRTKRIERELLKMEDDTKKEEAPAKVKDLELPLSLPHFVPEYHPPPSASFGTTSSALLETRTGTGVEDVDQEFLNGYTRSIKFRRRLETPTVTLTSTGVGLDVKEKSIAKSFYPSTNYTAQFAHLLPNGRMTLDL